MLNSNPLDLEPKTKTISRIMKKVFKWGFDLFNEVGGKRTRTADICLAKAALYQLSYTPRRTFFLFQIGIVLIMEDINRRFFWAILDSNQGPHPYQGCALTN